MIFFQVNNYIQITLTTNTAPQKELIIALLSNAGYEGFEEEGNILKAFIKENEFNENILQQIVKQQGLQYTSAIIKETNWNAVWEANFEPVVVNSYCAVRAHFHAPVKNIQHQIIITPKMSFGTGHHATTYMMIAAMQQIDFLNKKVFDFGTGTGILAILAEKEKAANIIAIDNDSWSIENTKENIGSNNCHKIELLLYDKIPATKFDIILANINRHVILKNLVALKQQLLNGGVLLISGLLHTDEEIILHEAKKAKLLYHSKMEKNSWLCLRFHL
jgi:ribosomal protein L11 methyltransferase